MINPTAIIVVMERERERVLLILIPSIVLRYSEHVRGHIYQD